jgi:hypothetical protein
LLATPLVFLSIEWRHLVAHRVRTEVIMSNNSRVHAAVSTICVNKKGIHIWYQITPMRSTTVSWEKARVTEGVVMRYSAKDCLRLCQVTFGMLFIACDVTRITLEMHALSKAVNYGAGDYLHVHALQLLVRQGAEAVVTEVCFTVLCIYIPRDVEMKIHLHR